MNFISKAFTLAYVHISGSGDTSRWLSIFMRVYSSAKHGKESHCRSDHVVNGLKVEVCLFHSLTLHYNTSLCISTIARVAYGHHMYRRAISSLLKQRTDRQAVSPSERHRIRPGLGTQSFRPFLMHRSDSLPHTSLSTAESIV